MVQPRAAFGKPRLRGLHPSQPGGGAAREAWVKGVTAAANRLIELGVADPDRLGVQGTSYGGYATVLLITQTDRFKAAVNVSGKVDMISFYTDSPRLGVRNTHAPEKSQDRLGGTLWEYPERYLDQSAILHADRIKTPLLTISGDQDPNVPASQSREIFYALRRLGKEVEWVRYANGAHRPPNSVAESWTPKIESWRTRAIGRMRQEEDDVGSRRGGAGSNNPKTRLRLPPRASRPESDRFLLGGGPDRLGASSFRLYVARDVLTAAARAKRAFASEMAFGASVLASA